MKPTPRPFFGLQPKPTANGSRRRAEARSGPKTTPFSDIDLDNWKSYLTSSTDGNGLIVGSLWLLGPRDKTGPHLGDYWGNFVPQIPNQILRRFTKRGEIVVDLFSGMGTTLIECRRLGRHGIGVELNPTVARRSEERIAQAPNPYGISTAVLIDDATQPETRSRVLTELKGLGSSQAHSLILHPPYHDIIKFSGDPRDLCNAPSLEDFLGMFRRAAQNAWDLLQKDHFMALVIGDKYTQGQWVPLGYECMRVCRDMDFRLKAINIKDIQGNERGKGKSENLWKYRALKEGFYIFKHEYIMIFQKP